MSFSTLIDTPIPKTFMTWRNATSRIKAGNASGLYSRAVSLYQLAQINRRVGFYSGIEAVVNAGDFFQIVLQHLLAIAVVNPFVNLAVDIELRLCNQLLIFAIFGFNVVLNGVAVKTIRQRNVNTKVLKQDKAKILSGAQLIA